MSELERSPKRQRTSLSPASPPYHLSKQEPRPKPFVQHPQTPQSPSRMSGGHGSPPFSQTIPTPPATVGLLSNTIQPSTAADEPVQLPGAVSQDTPVSMSRGRDEDTHMTVQDEAEVQEPADHRQTRHDRKGEQGEGSYRGQIDPLPLLCRTSHQVSTPHPSEDLLSLYDLNRIASSVARKDPLTGEKINKLRKSYEGKVKNQGLPGRNKPTDRQGELLGFMEWPEEGWYDQRVYGKELENALEGPLMAKLEQALSLQPGRLPVEEHDRWKNVLGLEEATSSRVPPASKSAAQSVLQRTQPTTMRASAPASPRGGVARPDRAGKKRRYDDASFEGYHEAYQDDDGYLTGGADDRRSSATKKRRRDFGGHEGSHSESSSMVGVKI